VSQCEAAVCARVFVCIWGVGCFQLVRWVVVIESSCFCSILDVAGKKAPDGVNVGLQPSEGLEVTGALDL